MGNHERRGFEYRIACAWLPQLGPDPYPLLFSSEASDSLIQAYAEGIPRLAKLGFNYLQLAGLVGESGAAQLPLDMERGFSQGRDQLIKDVIGMSHDAGMQYIAALGVYSWGFEEIIRAHPELAALRLSDPDLRRSGWDEELLPYIDSFGPATIPATDVLCASREESWDWMRRSIDLQLERYPEMDGYHLESADQGRCWCEQCRKISTPEYHVILYERCAEYLRKVAPNKPLFMTNCGSDWGTIRALPLVQRMAKYADFITDYMDSFRTSVKISLWGRYETIDQRHKAVKALTCSFGNTLHVRDAGLPRDKFFQPLPQSFFQMLRSTYEQGCTGLEYYSVGPFSNPGAEFNTELVGAMLMHPTKSYGDLVGGILDRLYKPRDKSGLERLIDIFEEAELAAAESGVDFNQVHHTVHQIERGIPQYTREIPIFGLASYAKSLERLGQAVSKLAPQLQDKSRASSLVKTVHGAHAAMSDALESRLSGKFEGTPLRAFVRAT